MMYRALRFAAILPLLDLNCGKKEDAKDCTAMEGENKQLNKQLEELNKKLKEAGAGQLKEVNEELEKTQDQLKEVEKKLADQKGKTISTLLVEKWGHFHKKIVTTVDNQLDFVSNSFQKDQLGKTMKKYFNDYKSDIKEFIMLPFEALDSMIKMIKDNVDTKLLFECLKTESTGDKTPEELCKMNGGRWNLENGDSAKDPKYNRVLCKCGCCQPVSSLKEVEKTIEKKIKEWTKIISDKMNEKKNLRTLVNFILTYINGGKSDDLIKLLAQSPRVSSAQAGPAGPKCVEQKKAFDEAEKTKNECENPAKRVLKESTEIEIESTEIETEAGTKRDDSKETECGEAEKAFDEAEEQLMKCKEIAGEAGEVVTASVGELFNGAVSELEESVGEVLASEVYKNVEKLAENASNGLKAAAEKANGAVEDLSTAAKNTFENASNGLEKAAEKASDAVSEAAKEAYEKAGEFGDDAGKAFEKFSEAAKNAFSETWGNLFDDNGDDNTKDGTDDDVEGVERLLKVDV